MFKGKKVLVTGGTGMIGKYLVELLLERGSTVRIASIDDPSMAHPETEFIHANLMDINNCLKVCKGMDYVFHLAGIKGSPAVTTKKPASFFVPTILFSTNMMAAAHQCGVEKYLNTSTIGVYCPKEVYYENDVWETFPSENDRIGGWAKRMGELQAEAYAIEYGWKEISIVRPANVYGRYDNFSHENSMVIPSLIKRAIESKNSLVVWGDGTAIRDFIHAKDVSRGMVFAMEKGVHEPVNLGSGNGVSICELVEVIVSCLDKKLEIVWDTSKPSGDKKRLMDMSRMVGHGFETIVSLEDGIRDTIQWYKREKGGVNKSYNVFAEGIKFN